MTTNIQLCKDWIKLSSSDWQIAKSAQREKNIGPCVYHLQQFAEKLVKALICLFAEEPAPSHFPSKQLRKIIDVRVDELSEEVKKAITNIITLATTLEDERTRPRYGIRHKRRIKLPEEYYSEEDIELFFEDCTSIATQLSTVLSKISLKSFEKEIQQLKGVYEDND